MAALLTDAEIADALGGLREWAGDRAAIARTVTFGSFPDAVEAVRRVADVAERLDHHPDIDIRWRTVLFRASTHSAGGVTALDVELARGIDAVVAALV